nr:hypothetical protein GCM10020185_49440 [Pseudomonas brassicacearum subsp. brassicacearum]
MLKALKLSELTSALNARLIAADATFDGVSIDSRAIAPGQLFVALAGPRFDGHDYLNEVAAKGAVAALVEREVTNSTLPQLLVNDTRQALGQLGALNRAAYGNPVAAITGSSGKTTVKEMLASILRTRGPVLATRGNLNNDLGVPLTLLELAPEHSAAVIELGASRLGEIAYTVGMTKPHVAVLNNAGTAHVGEFGGPEKNRRGQGRDHRGAGCRWRRRAESRRQGLRNLEDPGGRAQGADLCPEQSRREFLRQRPGPRCSRLPGLQPAQPGWRRAGAVEPAWHP